MRRWCRFCGEFTEQVRRGYVGGGSGRQRWFCRVCECETTGRVETGYDESLREYAVQLRERGYSYRVIGELLGVSHQSVFNWVNGLKPKRRRHVGRGAGR
jgi:transposase-like protein